MKRRVVNLRDFRLAKGDDLKQFAIPADVIRIDRRSKWGNPFAIGEPHPDDGHVQTRTDVLERFRDYATSRLAEEPDWLEPLEGKRLACWCAPLPCHGDIILELLMDDRDPDDVGLAWDALRVTMPEGWYLRSLRQLTEGGGKGDQRYVALHGPHWRALALSRHDLGVRGGGMLAIGPTAAMALWHLRDQLTKAGSKPRWSEAFGDPTFGHSPGYEGTGDG